MKYKIVITEKASTDLDQIITYIKDVLLNPEAALRWLQRISQAIDGLESLPERYALADDPVLEANAIRWFSVGNYLVFYTVSDNDALVFILRVLYRRRNWKIILQQKT